MFVPGLKFHANPISRQNKPMFSDISLFHRNLENNNTDIPRPSFISKEACMDALLLLSPFEVILDQV